MAAKILQMSDPDRADLRMIYSILQTHFKKKRIQKDIKSFEKVSWVFDEMGGSWTKLFKGGMEDFDLLKRVIRTAIKIKFLQSKPKSVK